MARVIRSPSALARKKASQEAQRSERRENEREERWRRLALKAAADDREAITEEISPVEDHRAA